MTRMIVAIALVALVLAGCSTDSGGGDGRVNGANDRAQIEFRACEKQADRIAATQGADAGSAHLDECVDALANGTSVQP